MINKKIEDVLVSIGVPVYNRELSIEKCINSLSNQSYKNTEIICVDDGSTDGSYNILKNLAEKDHRIKIIKLEKNAGACNARNISIEEAKGKYITFVDSDDHVHAEYIQKMLEQMNGVDLVACNSIVVGKERKITDKIETFKVDDKFNKKLTNTLWDKLFSTKIIKDKNLKFNKKITLGEDLIFVLGYLDYCSNITLIPDILYYYEPDSISMTNVSSNDFDKFYKYAGELLFIIKGISTLKKFKTNPNYYFSYIVGQISYFFRCIEKITPEQKYIIMQKKILPALSRTKDILKPVNQDIIKILINNFGVDSPYVIFAFRKSQMDKIISAFRKIFKLLRLK